MVILISVEIALFYESRNYSTKLTTYVLEVIQMFLLQSQFQVRASPGRLHDQFHEGQFRLLQPGDPGQLHGEAVQCFEGVSTEVKILLFAARWRSLTNTTQQVVPFYAVGAI